MVFSSGAREKHVIYVAVLVLSSLLNLIYFPSNRKYLFKK